MSLSNFDVAHRWANRDLGKNGALNGHHLYADEISLTSYSTVIAQHLDTNLVVIIDQNLTPSTSKHIMSAWSACSHKRIIRCHVNMPYTYNDVSIISRYGKSDNWKNYLVKVLIDDIREYANKYMSGNSLMSSEESHIRRYAEELRWLYENGYCVKAQIKKQYGNEYAHILDIALSKERFDMAVLVDYVCGRNTYSKWVQRSEDSRKASKTRDYINWINKHLPGIQLTRKEIDRLMKRGYCFYESHKITRIDFVNIWCNSGYKVEKRGWNWGSDHEKKIKRYILGAKCDDKSYYSDVEGVVTNVFTGEEYDLRNVETWCYGHHLYHDEIWDTYYTICGRSTIKLDINSYRQSSTPKEWLKHFYKRCKIQALKVKAYNIWAIHNNIHDRYNREIPWNEKTYTWVLNRVEQHRIEEAERQRIKAKEERRIAEAKLAEYNTLIAQGVDGCRELWRKKYASVSEAQKVSPVDSDFYCGGNVLLRWQNYDTIETSKSIRISVTQAKKAWSIIKKWHDCPETFQTREIHTLSGTYTVRSYENDILTAGCHSIAYCEMERMYNEILKQEVA